MKPTALLCAVLRVGRVAGFMVCVTPAAGADGPPQRTLSEADSLFLQALPRDHLCPCGCGNYLPGSPRRNACFGCSVGLAELARAREALLAGTNRGTVLLRVTDPLIIDVFSDYTDPNLPATWNRVRRVAASFDVHRVVLRARGETPADRRAIQLMECARRQHRFTAMQERLIAYSGPWDEAALLKLAYDAGMDTAQAHTCMQVVDVYAQIVKDREHAEQRKMERFPATCINGRPVPATTQALEEAIRDAIQDSSL